LLGEDFITRDFITLCSLELKTLKDFRWDTLAQAQYLNTYYVVIRIIVKNNPWSDLL